MADTDRDETVWVDDNGDLLTSVKGDHEDLNDDVRIFVNQMLTEHNAHFIFSMNLDTGQVTFTSNVPIDLQIEMLQNAIDNLKRIGQKA